MNDTSMNDTSMNDTSSGSDHTAAQDSPSELRKIAERIAHEVGIEILERRAAGFSWETKSTSTDVVTEIDTWSEERIVELISTARPNDGVLGEEGTTSEGTTGIIWVIDPVDGTTNFLYDLVGYSVSIGVERDGSAIAGAVYDPLRAELYSAATGEGATRNGEPISASQQDNLAHALVATGFSYSADVRREQAKSLITILPSVRDIRRFGGAALDLCQVASGRVDAYFELDIQPWDGSAGALIASEAGADVTLGEMTIASAPGIADELKALLGRAVT